MEMAAAAAAENGHGRNGAVGHSQRRPEGPATILGIGRSFTSRARTRTTTSTRPSAATRRTELKAKFKRIWKSGNQ
jgi:hypothetical protein